MKLRGVSAGCLCLRWKLEIPFCWEIPLWLSTVEDLTPPLWTGYSVNIVLYNPIILAQQNSCCLMLVLFKIKGKSYLCNPALPHHYLASQYEQGIYQSPKY